LLQKYDIIIKFKNLNPESGSMDVKKCNPKAIYSLIVSSIGPESGSMDVKKCNPKAIYSLIVSSIGKCEFSGKFYR